MVEMKKLGVIGNPIKHSLSPEIHTIFAREHGIDISYTKIESTIDSFNIIYGSLGALIAVLAWSYFSSMALMWGAQISSTYKQVRFE